MKENLTYLGFHYWADLSVLCNSSVVVDAGACIGRFVDRIKKCGNFKIVCIEPCKSNVSILRDRFDDITIIEGALSGQDGMVEFAEFHGLEEWGNSNNLRLSTSHEKLKSIESYDVRCFTIAGLMSQLNIERIDYLKMGIEGSESDVVRSIGEDSDIRQISLRVNENNSINDISHDLKDRGYVVEVEEGCQIFAKRIKE